MSVKVGLRRCLGSISGVKDVPLLVQDLINVPLCTNKSVIMYRVDILSVCICVVVDKYLLSQQTLSVFGKYLQTSSGGVRQSSSDWRGIGRDPRLLSLIVQDYSAPDSVPVEAMLHNLWTISLL